jgi:hypothetical protein
MASLQPSKPGRILVQPREHLAQPTDIVLRYPHEKLFANGIEDTRQVSGHPFPLCCRLENRKSPVPSKDIARDQPTCYKAIDKSSDFAFVSPERNG